MTAEKVQSWLQKACFTKDGFGKTGGGLVLKKVIQGRSEQIREYPVVDKDLDAKSIQQTVKLLGTTIYCDADDEAQGLGKGTWSFGVFAMRSGEKAHFAKRSFLVLIEGEDSEGLINEDATALGILAQTQRHLEAAMRTNAGLFPMVIQSWAAIHSATVDRLTQLESTQSETLRLLKDTIIAKDEREAKVMMEVDRYQKQQKVVDKMLAAAPLLLAHLAGGKPDASMLQTFMMEMSGANNTEEEPS